MSDLSDYLENTILDNRLSGTQYVALFTSDPTDADTGDEVSGPGYAREAVTFSAASGGQRTSDSEVNFAATGYWGIVTHIGIYDASTGGNLKFHRKLDQGIEMGDQSTVTIQAGNLIVFAD